VGDPDVVLDDRPVVGHLRLVDDVVIVAVDVDVVGQGDAVADVQLAAVVQMDVIVDDDVVAELDVVTVGERDTFEQPEVVACLREEMVGEHLPEGEGELDVVGKRRRVELPPEPLEMFRTLERILVFLGVVLTFECHVTGIVVLEPDLLGR